jgi:cation/acetate symporter
MDAQFWTYTLVGITFSLYIGIAIWSRAKSTKEFYIAGGGIHPVINGMATAADWMSAASFISMAGIISFLGYGGSQYLMGWTGGYVLLALCLAPYLRKFGKFTVPDFIGERYYSQNARTIALICAIFVSFTYVVGQMKGVGVAFSRFLEIPYDSGVIIGIAIVFFLCSSWRDERYYLYSSSSILCSNFCIYCPCYLSISSSNWKSNTSSWIWK